MSLGATGMCCSRVADRKCESSLSNYARRISPGAGPSTPHCPPRNEGDYQLSRLSPYFPPYLILEHPETARKVPQRQKARRRLWLNDGLCVRLRPNRANHVWSYDFVSAATHDGRSLRLLTLIDEYTRACLAIRVARHLESQEVIETLADVMLGRGIPEYLRSDNGPEFVARELRKWLARLGIGTLYIEPGSPWENGYCESFNGKLQDECLNADIFYLRKEAQVVFERWQVEYNTRRPHSALSYRPPVPAAYSPLATPSPVSRPRAVV